MRRPLRYYVERLRCKLGIHCLKAWRAPIHPEQVEAVPMSPRETPRPGDYRKCDSCGAQWEGCDNLLEPRWWPISRERIVFDFVKGEVRREQDGS